MSLARALKSILYLAIPTIIGNAGLILTIMVDTVMVAHFSTNELAYRSSANIIHFFLVTIVAGFTQGIGIASANFFGKQHYASCGKLITNSIFTLIFIGLTGTLIYWFGEYILLFFKQDPLIAAQANPILKILGLGFTPCIFYFAFAYFLESINKPFPIVIAVIVSNILNVFLNWVLIFGHLGFPAMGAIGSAISSSIIQLIAPLIMLLYIILMKEHKKFFRKPTCLSNKDKHGFILIGLGVALVLGAEEIGYAGNLIFAGWISSNALASYSLIMNVFMVCLTLSIGIAEATSILVGVQNGKKDIHGIKIITITSLLLNLSIMLVIAVILYFGTNFISTLYSQDVIIIGMLIPLLHILSLVIIIDSSQIILSNAIRGTKLFVIPTTTQIISSLFIMLPASWLCAIYFKMGILGLLIGIILSSSFTFITLLISFYFLIQHKKKQLRLY